MNTIGVGLIGTGYMGKCHALAWNGVKPVFGDGPKPRLVHLAEVSRGAGGAAGRGVRVREIDRRTGGR